MSITVCPPTLTETLSNPMDDTLRTSLGFTFWRTYRPSKSVAAPFVVPETTTAAPMTGCPVLSLTTPETVVCANITAPASKATDDKQSFLRIIPINK